MSTVSLEMPRGLTPIPAQPQRTAHTCCDGEHEPHEHNHSYKYPISNVAPDKPGFFTSIWQKLKAWIWGAPEDIPVISKLDTVTTRTPAQDQLHHAVPKNEELRTDSPAHLSQHNHNGCSDGTCSIKSTKPSTSQSAPSGGHIHSGGCCGSSSSTWSSPPSREALSRSPVTREIYSPGSPTKPAVNPLDSQAAQNAGAKLAAGLEKRLTERKTDRAFGEVLKSDTIFRNSISSGDRDFAKAVTREVIQKNPSTSTPQLTRVIKQEMTKKLDSAMGS